MADIQGQATEGYLELIRSRGSIPAALFPPIKHDKLIGRSFVQGLGVRTAKELRRFGRIEDIDIEGISAPFVLKPTFLSTSHGVFLLRPTAERDLFFDDRKQELVHRSEIIDEISRRSAGSEYDAKKWIVEERIVDSGGHAVPEDVKFFCFYGEVGLIQVVQRAKPRNRVAFFDGNFRRLDRDPERSGIKVNPLIVDLAPLDRPAGASELLKAAKNISGSLPTPFVRVDLYDTPQGPVFGEFTFTPGTFYYEDREVMLRPLSSYLGGLWRRAEEAIISGGVIKEEHRELLGLLCAGEMRWPNLAELRTGEFAMDHSRRLERLQLCSYRGAAPEIEHDALHDVPIRRYASLDEAVIDPIAPARYIVQGRGEVLPLDFLVYPRDSSRLLVGIHGAELRQTANLPKFQFVRPFLTRDESLLFLSDSTLLQGEKINLGWMAGTQDSHLIPRYADVVARVQEALAASQSVLVGHSAGGFMSIAIGSMVAGSLALSVNGQTVLEYYEPWTIRQLRETVFPSFESDQDMLRMYPERFDLRHILDRRLEGTRFAFFAHADDPNTMSRLPMFPLLAEHFSVNPKIGGRTESGDVLAVCRWATAENVSVHALPGTVLPFLDAALGVSTDFEFGSRVSMRLA